jgi:transcriptional regulator with XRE-family HTH domain
MVSFGGLVADRRKAIKMSQEELAKEAGISRNYVSVIERNEAHNLTVRTLCKLADALRFDAEFLFIRYAEWQSGQEDGLKAREKETEK